MALPETLPPPPDADRPTFSNDTVEMIEDLLMTVQRIAKVQCAVTLRPPDDMARIRECWDEARRAVLALRRAVDDAAELAGT